MLNDLDEAACKILRDYRHLMTEAERRADRAFFYQAKIAKEDNPDRVEQMHQAMEQALSDPLAADYFERGRQRFLQILARRVLAEHEHELPRCMACGEVFKTPHPKQCIACDYYQHPPDEA